MEQNFQTKSLRRQVPSPSSLLHISFGISWGETAFRMTYIFVEEFCLYTENDWKRYLDDCIVGLYYLKINKNFKT